MFVLTSLRKVMNLTTLFVLAIFFATASASPLPTKRGPTPPAALPQNATVDDLRWQPVLDFGTNGCYNVPAVDAEGYISEGLPNHFASTSKGCHDLSDLLNNNVYSRQRCNSNWCIYLYDYYFEKDVATPHFIDVGHVHDWEHIAVWVWDGDELDEPGPKFVAASAHGNYDIRAAPDVMWDGERPKMVYFKDGIGTHHFRFAKPADEPVENDLGIWFRGDLVSYNGFPPGLRDHLYAHDFGRAHIALTDGSFPDNIKRAKPKGVKFDENLDVGSPGTPKRKGGYGW